VPTGHELYYKLHMTDPTWRPLPHRDTEEGRRAYDALHEGVPDWLLYSLLDWAVHQFPAGQVACTNVLKTIERRLRCPTLDWSRGLASAKPSLIGLVQVDRERLLALVDFWLTDPAKCAKDNLVDLAIMLEEGGSVWRVARAGKGCCLERRLLPEAQAIGELARQGSGKSADYIRLAWQDAFGRKPNPNQSFNYSIKAIEAALAPVVTPNDPKATLGKLIPAIRDAPRKWTLRLHGKPKNDSVLAFVGLLELVWTSQLRHGVADKATPLEHSPGEAHDTALIAALVVQIVNDGGFVPSRPSHPPV
jgi:hypothetical protein